ncbi:phage protein Gp27 family protein [Xanthobacter sp. 126]|uniref:phage protein Gp27 family protein n=1 Tax=Xanthobacter sp. 126 TaxID=1131814 RepID=UPI00045E9537|nr:phage protein Gp27 family protein [Xanthobacter sp. 126]
MAPPRGRGRLSEIDRLPEWADEAKMAALVALKERKLTQLEILEQFNAALRAAAWEQGIATPPQISLSAFNRTAVRLAVHGRRMEETREIAAVLAPKIDEAGDASLTLLISETIKTLVFEMLGNAGELSADGDTAEMLMFTSRALKHAEEAKKISTEQRRKFELEFKAKTDEAVEKVVKARGGTADDIAALREAIGVQIAKKG